MKKKTEYIKVTKRLSPFFSPKTEWVPRDEVEKLLEPKPSKKRVDANSKARYQETRKVVSKYREKLRQRHIAAKGGSCNRCGYKEFSSALEFHHIDESKKEHNISSLISRVGSSKTFSTAKRMLVLLRIEIDKCVLLCSNCHQGLHNGEWDIDSLKQPRTNVPK